MKKKILSVLLVLCMMMQVMPVAFAGTRGTICYEADGLNVTASIAVRGLDEQTRLITAVYDADGNVVSSDISETVGNATDALLIAKVTKSNETDVVKSFLWTCDDNEPIKYPGVMGHKATESDVKLFFDGVPFEEAIGEALDFGKTEYTYVISTSSSTLTIPKITYEVEDSTIDLDIATDGTEMKSVITIKSGVRIAEKTTVYGKKDGVDTNPSDKYIYSKPYVETITINYTYPEAKGMILNNMVASKSGKGFKDVSGSSATGFNGLVGARNNVTSDYQMDFELPEGAEYGKVSFIAKSFDKQYSLIVVEPLEDTTADNTVVYSDGTPLAWQNDTGVVVGYDYQIADLEARKLEEFDASRQIFGKMSLPKGTTSGTANFAAANQPMELSYKTSATGNATQITYAVCKDLHASDDYFLTGSRAQWNRTPAIFQIEYDDIDESLAGCNYMTLDGNTTYAEATIAFYVNQNVRVHFITNKSGLVVAPLDAEGNQGATVTAKTTTFRRRYQNAVDAISMAYFVANGYMAKSDLYLTSASATGMKFQYTSGDTTYKYCSPKGNIRKWINLDYISNYIAPYGIHILPEYFEDIGLTTTTSEDGKTITVDGKTYDEYCNLFKVTKAHNPLVTDLTFAMSGSYNGTKITKIDSLVPIITDFNNDGKNSIFRDRTGMTQHPLLTGMIVSYPEAFDLEDSVFMTSSVKLCDGEKNAVSNPYGNTAKLADYTPYLFYTFKVNRDAEVVLYSYTKLPEFDKEGSGWRRFHAGNPSNERGEGFGSLKYCYRADYGETQGKYRYINYIYVKEFSAGDTVEMYTPGNSDSSYFLPFVKELR